MNGNLATIRPLRLSTGNRPSFTLVEMLVVLAVIALLAVTLLSGMQGVQETARIARTKGMITRLNEILMMRWESYRSRAVPYDASAWGQANRANSRAIAYARLLALRDLMRMELPDRKSDIVDGPIDTSITITNNFTNPPTTTTFRAHIENPALRTAYIQRVIAAAGSLADADWTPDYQGAECLYMIVAASRDGGTVGLDHFKPSEIGDVDGDGMPEFLDGWGNPIEFLRWAPGFVSDLPTTADDPTPMLTMQTRDATVAPDPFDPLQVDPRTPLAEKSRNPNGALDPTDDPFALYPLIFSAGQDESYDIVRDFSTPLRYRPVGSNPYTWVTHSALLPTDNTSTPSTRPVRLGTPADTSDDRGVPAATSADGSFRFTDNIYSHALDARLQAN